MPSIVQSLNPDGNMQMVEIQGRMAAPGTFKVQISGARWNHEYGCRALIPTNADAHHVLTLAQTYALSLYSSLAGSDANYVAMRAVPIDNGIKIEVPVVDQVPTSDYLFASQDGYYLGLIMDSDHPEYQTLRGALNHYLEASHGSNETSAEATEEVAHV